MLLAKYLVEKRVLVRENISEQSPGPGSELEAGVVMRGQVVHPGDQEDGLGRGLLWWRARSRPGVLPGYETSEWGVNSLSLTELKLAVATGGKLTQR